MTQFSLHSHRLLSIVIGLLFLVSGFSKIIDSNGFIKLLFRYGLGSFSYIGPLLSPIEVLLGLCLIINTYVKKTAFFVFFLTIISKYMTKDLHIYKPLLNQTLKLC
ncbi:MauE/DoxX family redox-associated membrane protein [Emticicia soli]|uniref:MauE/DoxX family redox-associated membrane protein n=1 Tax=Emticicia soli TaxID=2027878 RepID=A0ABW5J3N1_9BACT